MSVLMCTVKIKTKILSIYLITPFLQSFSLSVTFLLQGELSLGFDVLQRRSQVPGQATGIVGHQQGALLSGNRQNIELKRVTQL